LFNDLSAESDEKPEKDKLSKKELQKQNKMWFLELLFGMRNAAMLALCGRARNTVRISDFNLTSSKLLLIALPNTTADPAILFDFWVRQLLPTDRYLNTRIDTIRVREGWPISKLRQMTTLYRVRFNF
jgi:hypothetical protein